MDKIFDYYEYLYPWKQMRLFLNLFIEDITLQPRFQIIWINPQTKDKKCWIHISRFSTEKIYDLMSLRNQIIFSDLRDYIPTIHVFINVRYAIVIDLDIDKDMLFWDVLDDETNLRYAAEYITYVLRSNGSPCNPFVFHSGGKGLHLWFKPIYGAGVNRIINILHTVPLGVFEQDFYKERRYMLMREGYNTKNFELFKPPIDTAPLSDHHAIKLPFSVHSKGKTIEAPGYRMVSVKKIRKYVRAFNKLDFP